MAVVHAMKYNPLAILQAKQPYCCALNHPRGLNMQEPSSISQNREGARADRVRQWRPTKPKRRPSDES